MFNYDTVSTCPVHNIEDQLEVLVKARKICRQTFQAEEVERSKAEDLVSLIACLGSRVELEFVGGKKGRGVSLRAGEEGQAA